MAKRHRVLVSDKISQRALETLQKSNIDFDSSQTAEQVIALRRSLNLTQD